MPLSTAVNFIQFKLFQTEKKAAEVNVLVILTMTKSERKLHVYFSSEQIYLWKFIMKSGFPI